MSLGGLFELIYQAMLPEFTVFGYTINLYSFFVFSCFVSVIIWFINNFTGRW